jgi:hypothetical protein
VNETRINARAFTRVKDDQIEIAITRLRNVKWNKFALRLWLRLDGGGEGRTETEASQVCDQEKKENCGWGKLHSSQMRKTSKIHFGILHVSDGDGRPSELNALATHGQTDLQRTCKALAIEEPRLRWRLITRGCSFCVEIEASM